MIFSYDAAYLKRSSLPSSFVTCTSILLFTMKLTGAFVLQSAIVLFQCLATCPRFRFSNCSCAIVWICCIAVPHMCIAAFILRSSSSLLLPCTFTVSACTVRIGPRVVSFPFFSLEYCNDVFSSSISWVMKWTESGASGRQVPFTSAPVWFSHPAAQKHMSHNCNASFYFALSSNHY